ncbi:MAG: DUF1592 domain-containing protein, partial [Myxococcota bacterium]|nr:DUF1592 domain-containing protein [Myxococcota bacterium]
MRTGSPITAWRLLLVAGAAVAAGACGGSDTPAAAPETEVFDATSMEDIAPETGPETTAPDVAEEVAPPEPEIIEEVTEELPEPEAVYDPGVLLRRLNRDAYNRTVSDLIGVPLTPADDFPVDFVANGFDHLSDHLSVSPLLMELWGSAAETLAEQALLEIPAEPVSFKLEADGYDIPASFPEPGVGIVLYDATPAVFAVEIPADDTWEIGLMAFGTAGDGASVTLTLRVDGATKGAWAAYKDPATATALTVEVPLTAGPHEIAITMTNPTPPDPDVPIPEQDWSSAHLLHVDWLQFTATTLFEDAVDNGSKVMVCDPLESDEATCGTEILETFASRAWRRPLTDQEVADLLVFVESAVDDGRGFDRGIQVAIEAILLSPHFLFLVEGSGDDPEDLSLTDHEIATRLSYFLWNSMPDDLLFAAADDGLLQDPEEIASQVDRMLDDPRSQGLVENLADQWLMGRIMKYVSPSPAHYPDFDEDLRSAMIEEVHLFLGSFVEKNRSIKELLDSIDLYVNNRLRQHYGLPPGIEDFEHLIVHDTERGGLLGQAGILTALSPPTRTSPTRRGKWVLERLLCDTVPPPPP